MFDTFLCFHLGKAPPKAPPCFGKEANDFRKKHVEIIRPFIVPVLVASLFSQTFICITLTLFDRFVPFSLADVSPQQ